MKKILVLWLALLLFFGIVVLDYFTGFPFDLMVKDKFSCPVSRKYCKSGEVIKIEGNYFGIGYKVPEGESIFAAVNGQVQGKGTQFPYKLGGERFPGLILKNKERNIEVNYIFTGEDLFQVKEVNKGEEIIKISEGEVANFGVNLLVTIYDTSNGERKLLEYKPNVFNKSFIRMFK